jgi:murein DD-endopeptidase MepM/ murein hydrolase activator NlpD/LAS superfamily LD-carboxypeptidase LdcB
MDPALWELLAEGQDDDEVAAIIRLENAEVAPPNIRIVAQFGNIATARLRRDQIIDVHADESVASLKAPRLIAPEANIPVSEDLLDAEFDERYDRRRPDNLNATGRNVVVGVIDWGCDFAHPNFRHTDGRTRLLALWDQRRPRRGTDNRYGYGTIHTADDINRALATNTPYEALNYNPADSDIGELGSHGTHVLDIAAGNGAIGGPVGVAPEADLVFVHLDTRGTSGLANLGDSITILEAVDFILRVAEDRPCAINMSVGRIGGPHDGLTLVEQGLDAAVVATPGRAIVHSTGNYYNQRTHTSGLLLPNERHDLTFFVDAADRTPNEIEVWYPGRDEFTLGLTSPSGEIHRRVMLGEDVAVHADGRRILQIYHRADDPNNHDHHMDIFLYPGAPPGEWKLTLHGENVVDGHYHAWIERDAGCNECQVRFRPEEAVVLATTGTICNGFKTIAVGAYDARSPELALAPFSSSGPVRDGRQKPNLIAPGVAELAARSTPQNTVPGSGTLGRKSGTSMAAPHVTGTVALMFEVAGRPLAIHETHRLLLDSTDTVDAPGDMRYRVGNGRLNIVRTVQNTRQYIASQNENQESEEGPIMDTNVMNHKDTEDLLETSLDGELDDDRQNGAAIASDPVIDTDWEDWEEEKYAVEGLQIAPEYGETPDCRYSPPLHPAQGYLGRCPRACFGIRPSRRTAQPTWHGGVDFQASPGTPVYAVAAGVIENVGEDTDRHPGFQGYGNCVVIYHGEEQVWSFYAHLSRVLATPGQSVTAGTSIGLVGNTSNSRFPGMGPHLHFEIRRARPNGSSPYPGSSRQFGIDPIPWLAAHGVVYEPGARSGPRLHSQACAPSAEEAYEMANWLDEDDLADETTFWEEELDATENIMLGQLHINTTQTVVTTLTSHAGYTTTTLDDALQFALNQRDTHTIILGNMLTGNQFEVYRWRGNVPTLPLVISFDSRSDIALIIFSGRDVYMPVNPISRGLRWVKLNRASEFYALATPDQNAQRRSWINSIYNARRRITVPGVTITSRWLNSLSTPALRLLLAHFGSAIFQPRRYHRPTRSDGRPRGNGYWLSGVTLPILQVPLTEPDCYLPVIAGREGKMESINTWDEGAGVSLGPIQFNVIDAHLFSFLWRVWQRDNALFQEAFGSLNWTMRSHDGHRDLLINAGGTGAITLHGRGTDRNRNVGYFHSGIPGNSVFNQIDPAFRRDMTERFRTLVVWPHIHELIIETTSDYLLPGLRDIHDPANHIPALDPSNPDRDTFILKALLLSVYVRYRACLSPLLQALRRWSNPTDKLRNWANALNATGVNWGHCTAGRRGHLVRRLTAQEREARQIYEMLTRAMAAGGITTMSSTTGTVDEEEREAWDDDLEIYDDVLTGDKCRDAIFTELYEIDEMDCGGSDHGADSGELAVTAEELLPTLVEAANPLAALLESESAPGAEMLSSVSTGEVFRALAYDQSNLSQPPQIFEVVAYPGETLVSQLRDGDILLRRGAGPDAHVAVLASGELVTADYLEKIGATAESRRTGQYTVVIEGGAFPHTAADRYFRRVLDAYGRMPREQMILRLKGLEAAEAWVDAENIPSTNLRWDSATGDQLAFMRRVYDEHVRRASQRRTFTPDVPDSDLAVIEGNHQVRTAAAQACRNLLADARQALQSEQAAGSAQAQSVSFIRITSAYRSASRQFRIWQRNFPRYYAETEAERQRFSGGEHGSQAVQYLARYIGRRVAAPGYSLHNNGLAVDFTTRDNNRTLGANSQPANIRRWRQSWFYQWLTANASRYGFRENDSINEPWHWEYRPTISSGASLNPAIETDNVADIDWCQMWQTIARIARAEEQRWTRPDGTKFLENHPSRLPILESYWRTVPGFTTAAAAAAAAQQSANDTRAWSAAFICFVMHTAGVRQAHGFEFGQRHMNYIVGALRNREQSDRNRVFWLYDEIEVQNEATPQIGDLLCFNREVNGVMTNHSYASLRNSFWLHGNQNVPPTGSSHCSIVVGMVERNGRRFIQIIGGNERHSVRLQEIPIDRFGGIPNPQAHNIFGIIKLLRC